MPMRPILRFFAAITHKNATFPQSCRVPAAASIPHEDDKPPQDFTADRRETVKELNRKFSACNLAYEPILTASFRKLTQELTANGHRDTKILTASFRKGTQEAIANKKNYCC